MSDLKRFLGVVAVPLLVAAGCANPDAAQPPGSASPSASGLLGSSTPGIHANQFEFVNISGTPSLSTPPVAFIFCPATGSPSPTATPNPTSCFSVTKDQPWGGVTDCPTAVDYCTITVNAGRNNSTPVAQWFAQYTSVACAEPASMSCNGMPSELNFAITGNVIIGSDTYQMVLGQGHGALDGNNWWFGGPGWTFCQNVGKGMCTPDGKYEFSPNENDQVEVSTVPA